jgi:DNA polymerase
MDRAGIDRRDVYLTNAVKHFKWTLRGKRRIHRRPAIQEMAACRPWLEAEVQAVRPDIIVCLGATAARSVIGGGFRVTQSRGTLVQTALGPVVATVHPSAILRVREEDERASAMDAFVRDLRSVARRLAAAG